MLENRVIKRIVQEKLRMNELVGEDYLFIINDAPYGNERPYNALRLAYNILKRQGSQVRVFLSGDGVFCARKGQKTPDGYYNIERMIKALAIRGKVAT